MSQAHNLVTIIILSLNAAIPAASPPCWARYNPARLIIHLKVAIHFLCSVHAWHQEYISCVLRSVFATRDEHIFWFFFSGPQLHQTFKPLRQLLCTFSSCSVLSINMIYNIYKFQGKLRTKKASLIHFTFTFTFTSRPAGRGSTAMAVTRLEHSGFSRRLREACHS